MQFLIQSINVINKSHYNQSNYIFQSFELNHKLRGNKIIINMQDSFLQFSPKFLFFIYDINNNLYNSQMDENNIKFAGQIIKTSYATLGFNSIQKRIKIMKLLLTQRQLPDEGLDQLTISYIMDQLALMDSNNFHDKIGVGERQSRIFSPIVQRRNFHMGHGIGRSGDVMANQPKAAGSSLLLQLTKFLTVSAFKQLNYDFVKDVLLLPMATGMALTMVFLTLAQKRPDRKYVIWSRIDQKTCLKSIITANLTAVVVQLIHKGDGVQSTQAQIQKKILEIGPEKILCIVSTTSCFAPRLPDDIQGNSLLAKKYEIYHVVNNAYGVWCTKIAHSIKKGLQNGQCSAVVQSMDKNFMVPVGGSIVFTQKDDLLKGICSKYPGRASSGPIVDLFITLLSMGKNNIEKLKKQRKQNYKYMLAEGQKFAKKYNFRILKTEGNTISICMHLKLGIENITQLGAVLYSKRVMGHRIVAQSQNLTKVGNHQFQNYGSHVDKYQFLPYITFACAVGTLVQEIDAFFKRLQQSIKEILKKRDKKRKENKLETERTQQVDVQYEKQGRGKKEHIIEDQNINKKQQKQESNQMEENKIVEKGLQIKKQMKELEHLPHDSQVAF